MSAALATPAFSQGFLGEWIATARVGDSDVAEHVSVAKAGDNYTVTAKLVSPQAEGAQSPEAGPATNIKLDGNNFSYARTLDFGGNRIEIAYKGIVTGDTFTATADAGGTTIPYTGVRVK